MARWSNTHCPNAVYWLGLMLYKNFLRRGRMSDWLPYTVSQTKVYKDFAEISGFYNFDEVFAHF